jgi:hypothetical protein
VKCFHFNTFIVVVGFISVLQCRNPFLPTTGRPVIDLSGRALPEGVLTQLIDAYNERNIDIFKDLLPKDGSFRFFVAPSYYTEFNDKHENLSEPRDTRLQFLEESEIYYYWTQNIEIENHERLFRYAEYLEFIDPPGLESKRKFVDGNDSLAELLITGGRLKFGQDLGFDTTAIYYVPIEKQVFLVKKDDDDLWVLQKWYDFSNIVGE